MPPTPRPQAPFCVHPKTGKVCVPLDPAAADDFDPDGREVPTVAELVAELAEGAKQQRQQQQHAGADADAGADQGTGKVRGAEATERCHHVPVSAPPGPSSVPRLWSWTGTYTSIRADTTALVLKWHISVSMPCNPKPRT